MVDTNNDANVLHRTNPVRNARQRDILRGRLTGSEINSFYNPAGTNTSGAFTGEGATVPVIYGRQIVDGIIIEQGYNATESRTYIAVAWCLGPAAGPTNIWINGEDMPAGVFAHHHNGKLGQIRDVFMNTYVTADATATYAIYNDDADFAGLCYTVFVIDDGTFTTAPRFKAMVGGRVCEDPRSYALYEPAIRGYANATSFAVHWDSTYTDTPGVDLSIFENSITVGGNCAQVGDFMNFPNTSTASYLTIPNANNLTPSGSGNWCYEIKAKHLTPVGTITPYLFGFNETIGGAYTLVVKRDVRTIKIYLSTNGTSYNVWNGATIGTFTDGVEFTICVERIAGQLTCTWNGGMTQRVQIGNATIIPATTAPLTIGSGQAAANCWLGTVRSMRVTKNRFRYGGDFASIDHNIPFSDWETQGLYDHDQTNNPALAFVDICRNKFFGMGLPEYLTNAEANNASRNGAFLIEGAIDAANWCDTLVGDAPGAALSTIALTIDQTRPSSEYLDLLATYAFCTWRLEGKNVVLIPERPYTANTNPSGPELVDGGDFHIDDNLADWTNSTGEWSVDTYTAGDLAAGPPYRRFNNAICDSTPSTASLTQSVAVENGKTYSVRVVLMRADSGTLTVKMGATTVIAATGDVGLLAGQYVAASTGNVTLTIQASAGSTIAIDDASVREQVLTISTWVKGSLRISSPAVTDTPTKVVVRYTQGDDVEADSYPEKEVFAAATSTLLPVVQTNLNMVGFRAESHAIEFAETKLARMSNALRVSCVITDIGLGTVAGDVVRLLDSTQGVDVYVVVDSVVMTKPGRWRITGTQYDASHYPAPYVAP